MCQFYLSLRFMFVLSCFKIELYFLKRERDLREKNNSNKIQSFLKIYIQTNNIRISIEVGIEWRGERGEFKQVLFIYILCVGNINTAVRSIFSVNVLLWENIKRWRNSVFATTPNLSPRYLCNLMVPTSRFFFKLMLFDPTEYKIWNIKGLQHRVAKI